MIGLESVHIGWYKMKSGLHPELTCNPLFLFSQLASFYEPSPPASWALEVT